MIRVEKNGLAYYRFEIFDNHPEVVHGVFTRQGGVSPPPFQELNLAFGSEDPEENVRENQKRAAGILGIESPAFVGQVHGDRALVVRGEDKYRPEIPSEVLRGYDALITPDPEVGLMTKLADCQGVLLYDPKTGLLAVIHSGWRGSVVNILGKTVDRMKNEFGVRPADILAGISPSLGPCCAEFVNYRTELPESFHAFGNGNYFNFWEISREQLGAAGVDRNNVEFSNICTKCQTDEFYSYRAEKQTGRFGLIACTRRNGLG